ncbi:MAG: radical SAM protein [Dehalococcoidia bacterium]
MKPQFRVERGKITTNLLDVNITEHCNLSCRGCNHFSPVLPKRLLTPEDFVPQLRALAEVLRPGVLKFLGGEPLLHPNIVDLIEAARDSGISERIALYTNGTLLHRAPEAVWRAVDEVQISSYPGSERSDDELAAFQALADRHKTELRVEKFDRFLLPYVRERTASRVVAQQIYDSCRFVHVYHCHTLADGHFFKCSQAYFLPKAIDGVTTATGIDAVHVSQRATLQADLLAYLNSPDPLDACGRCLGTAGPSVPHSQVKRDAWQLDAEAEAVDLLDPRRLAWRPKTRVQRLRDRLGPHRARLQRGLARALTRRG